MFIGFSCTQPLQWLRFVGVILWCGATTIFAQTPLPRLAAAQQPTTQPAILLLEDLEQMALQSNPTLAQADAAIRAAEGKRVQAGLPPNPIIGYAGEELAFRAIGEKSEHLAFIEQTIPLGGKLKKSRAIAAQERVQAEQVAAAQRQRILNGVRVLFYRALGAQQLVEVRTELAKLSRDAVKVTGELFNVGQADRPDAAQIRIEAERAELDLIMAENEQAQVWLELAAVVGNPSLKPARLVGELDKNLPTLEAQSLLQQLLANSPEIKRARAGVDRARTAAAKKFRASASQERTQPRWTACRNSTRSRPRSWRSSGWMLRRVGSPPLRSKTPSFWSLISLGVFLSSLGGAAGVPISTGRGATVGTQSSRMENHAPVRLSFHCFEPRSGQIQPSCLRRLWA
ncbi:MAG: TolC family protein [Acidobacteria bacterium]|nr:TolC family protein [Acidobacteriota bacterium]